MDEESLVKLIVKASNQQHDDQYIECHSNWSVKNLKERLCEVYPGKPKPDDQKLIYSGQLLKDNLILKDILRHYEGVQPQNHTFHLVYTPKYRFPTIPSASSSNKKSNQNTMNSAPLDGIRHRRTIHEMTTIASATSNNSASTIPQQINSNNILENSSIPSLYTHYAASINNNNCPTSGVNNGIPSVNPIGFQQFLSTNYALSHQAAMQNWMQQAYIQYMNQYMNLLSTGIRPEQFFMQNQSTGATNIGGLPQMPYSTQSFPFMVNTNLLNSSTSSNPTAAVAATPGNTVNNIQQEVVPQQQPRFPNLMNDDFQENRDWLDVFHSISRLMILLTLVYFYSSPMRCFLVFLMVLGIYLYHMTYFREQRQDDNNNGIRRPINQQQQRPIINVQQNGEPQQQQRQINNIENEAVDAIRRANTSEAGSTAVGTAEQDNTNTTEREIVSNNDEENANGTSMIAFLKTFVVSFIVSLLPETPPV